MSHPQTACVAETVAKEKPIPWLRRADLQIVALQFENRPAWGIKDPVTLGYFELRDESYFILSQLDGTKTASQLCDAFHERFRPRTLSVDDLNSFLLQLVGQGLVLSSAPGHGRMLVTRCRAAESRRRWNRLSSLLAIRFRGFDPDRMLSWMDRWLGWIFAPWAVFVGLVLIGSAVTLVAVQFDELLSRLPDARAMMTLTNLFWLSLLLAIVKVLHEFGHGLACKRFGGECHELGFMLLVFTPTMFCNVTDIWMIKNKWQRMAVGAAGMWIELLIAASCTVLWWFSTPGLFHSLCLNLMFLCGASTFIFNGNPLLRYDGYFVLADWLEVPNLQQQSNSVVRSVMSRWFCGFDEGATREMSKRRAMGLFAYGVASTIYRSLLTFVILWTLYHWLEPFGLGVVVQFMAVPTVGVMLLVPISNLISFVKSPANRAKMKLGRFVMRCGLVAAIVSVIVFLPLPSRVSGGALIDVDDAQAERVYVTTPGTLVESIRAGQHVTSGQVIARLDEPRLKVLAVQLEGELNLQKLRLEKLERRRVNDPTVAAAIPSQREVVLDLERQLTQRKLDAERLVLKATRDGIVMPVTHRNGDSASKTLPFWSGTPLDSRNLGCFLLAGTPVCLVGDELHRTAIVLIHQHDINLVREGQPVRIVWAELKGEILGGRISELAALNLDTLTRETVVRLGLPSRATPNGTLHPVGTWYQARVQLDECDAPLPLGAAGEARIHVDSQSLFSRAMRWIGQTFAW